MTTLKALLEKGSDEDLPREMMAYVANRLMEVLYSLIVTAKMNDIDPQVWIADVLTRMAEHLASKLDDLMPWNWWPDAPTLSRAS